MPATFATFTRLKDKGVAALTKGGDVAARPVSFRASPGAVTALDARVNPSWRVWGLG